MCFVEPCACRAQASPAAAARRRWNERSWPRPALPAGIPMKMGGTRIHDRATELVLSYYAAFNRADWDAMLGLLGADVVHDLNQGAREVGRDAFAAFLQRMARHYREQLRDIVVMASPDGARAGAEYV